MKEYGYLFKGNMVKAVLNGDKTQTRRKPTSSNCLIDGVGKRKWPKLLWDTAEYAYVDGELANDVLSVLDERDIPYFIKPRIRVGDEIYVKETWWCWGFWDKRKDGKFQFCDCTTDIHLVKYDADHSWANGTDFYKGPANGGCDYHRRPAIFMKKEYSRIRAKVNSVRFERIKDISDEDILAEGAAWMANPRCGGRSASGEMFEYSSSYLRTVFKHGWDKINEDRDWGLELNRPVIAIGFERISDEK